MKQQTTLTSEYESNGYARVYDRDQASGVADPFKCDECGKVGLHAYHGFRKSGRGAIVSISECPSCGYQSEY